MAAQFSTLGALIGLAIAIVLIIRKVAPAYCLILGALVGGLIGGVGLAGTVNTMVIGVSILLIGTGTIAGIIKASALQSDVTNLLAAMHMPAFILAPLSGVLMAAATASTTAGTTVLDSPPHGSFFHATGGSVGMGISKRMKLIPYEALVGLTSTIVAVVIYVIAG